MTIAAGTRDRESLDDIAGADPLALVKALMSLRSLTAMYPPGHPAIEQKVGLIEEAARRHLRTRPGLHIDIIQGIAHLDGVSFRNDTDAQAQMLRELTDLGIDSIHILPGVSRRELQGVAEYLAELRDAPLGRAVEAQLADRGIHHVSLGRLVPLDTRWQGALWPDAPVGPLDPAYAESLARTERTFEDATVGRGMNVGSVREVVELLIRKVAGSSAALGQILSMKLYENLTYCHSVNVATLSLLIGRQIGLDPGAIGALGEAALLHDIGKTRIPLDVLRKPGALDRQERGMMQAHTTLGAEILVEVEGLQPLTPTVALEHHRSVEGGGYPELGAEVVPHVLSQIVSVADIYEAVTGARSYQAPATPEQACLVLARLAGTKLNTALVKAFISAVSFFPVGSIVRTSRDEMAIVIRTNPSEPLHPVVARMTPRYERLPGEIDTSERDGTGGYRRHVTETIVPPEPLDFTLLLPAA
jgi:putative nucleotidyltransferase with HDIG domain